MWKLILIIFLLFSCERHKVDSNLLKKINVLSLKEVDSSFLNEKDGLIYYNGVKFTGKEIEYYYESDQKKFERHYKDGMLGGKIIKWYENGNKKAEGNYIYHNKNDYYGDGKHNTSLCYKLTLKKLNLKSEKFINRFSHGIFKTWYPNGVLKSKDNYVVGVKNGKSVEWHENGNKKIIIFYLNGLKNGTSETFYKNGSLKVRENYSNGLKNGTSETFHENRKLKISIDYSNGLKNGKIMEKYDSGRNKLIGFYLNDLKNGDFKEYDEYGLIKSFKKYKNDKLIKVYSSK